MTEEERQAQLAPLKNLQSSVAMDEVDSDLSVALYSDLGEHYDARDANLVTPVKYQNPFGICWAFSLLSNVETDLLANNLGTWDLSEEHLAYFLAHQGLMIPSEIHRMTNLSTKEQITMTAGTA